MRFKKLIYILLVLLSGQLNAQSIILELLYGEAKNVFRGKVEQLRYISSNAQGSGFEVKVNVEKSYKGNNSYEEVIFAVDKTDVIDLEFDTIIMDYSFQITQDSSYIFFTNEIHSIKTREKSGLTHFTSDIEGIPFTKDLERLIEEYDKFTFLTVKSNRNYPSSNFAFEKMRTNAESFFLGKVLEITEKQRKMYAIKVSTKTGDKLVISKNINCICREGEIKIGNEYLFYTNEDEANKFRLVDEWLGIIEPGEYDKFKLKK